MSSKLNDLLKIVTPGAFVLQSWLTEQGISRQLAYKYVQTGWLNRVSSGVYVRPGKLASWFDSVAAVSQQTDVSISLVGGSSLTYQGRAHYYNHDWLRRVDESKVRLGVGKRQIVKGGKLDKAYGITIPSIFKSLVQ